MSTRTDHLRASAANCGVLADIYASNADVAPNLTAADAWNTAALRLLDAQDALAWAADAIDGVWKPEPDDRQMKLEERAHA